MRTGVTDVDAVVVGGGHNGLVAANLLADAGWDVLVLEAADEVGGAVRSDRSLHPDYVTDLYSAFYPLSAASPVLAELELDRLRAALDARAARCWRTCCPTAGARCCRRDAERTAASLEAFAAGDGAAWLRLAEPVRADRASRCSRRCSRPFPAGAPGAAAGSAARLRPTRCGSPGCAVQPVRRFGQEPFAGEGGAAAARRQRAAHRPAARRRRQRGLRLAAGMLGPDRRLPGAGRRLRDDRSRRWRAGSSRGGGAHPAGAPVPSIDVRGGRASGGPAGRRGERIAARRAVLADVTAPALYRDLVGSSTCRPGFVDDLRQLPVGHPDGEDQLGAVAPIPLDRRRGPRGRHRAPRRRPGRPDPLRRRPRHPARAAQAVPAVRADDHRRPDPLPGRHRVGLGVHPRAARPRRSTDASDRRARRARRGAASSGTRRASPTSVVGRDVQSPADLQPHDAEPRRRRDQRRHGAAAPAAVLPAGTRASAAPTTPIDRLYLAGSSAHPGGGVHGARGANAALAALARGTTRGRAGHLAQARLLKRIYRGSSTRPSA